MSTYEYSPATQAAEGAVLARNKTERAGSTVIKWVTSTDHKVIGYMYLISSFFFFLVGGVMALWKIEKKK